MSYLNTYRTNLKEDTLKMYQQNQQLHQIPQVQLTAIIQAVSGQFQNSGVDRSVSQHILNELQDYRSGIYVAALGLVNKLNQPATHIHAGGQFSMQQFQQYFTPILNQRINEIITNSNRQNTQNANMYGNASVMHGDQFNSTPNGFNNSVLTGSAPGRQDIPTNNVQAPEQKMYSNKVSIPMLNEEVKSYSSNCGKIIKLTKILHGTTNDAKSSIIFSKYNRASSSSYEVAMRAAQAMPGSLKLGHWTHVITYNKLVSIPLPLKDFLSIRNKILEDFEKDVWSFDVLSDILENLPSKVSKVIDSYLKTEFVKHMGREIISLSEIHSKVNIDEVKDMLDVIASEAFHPHGVNMDKTTFRKLLIDKVLTRTIDGIFPKTLNKSEIPINVVHSSNNNIQNILLSSDLEYEKSKYDIIVNGEVPDVNTLLGGFNKNKTLFVIPNCKVIVTNNLNLNSLKMAGPLEPISHVNDHWTSISDIDETAFLGDMFALKQLADIREGVVGIDLTLPINDPLCGGMSMDLVTL